MTTPTQGDEMPKPQLVQTDSDYIKELTQGASASLAASLPFTDDQAAAVGAAIAKVEAPLPPFTVHSDSLRGELTAKSESLKKMAADIEDRIDARRIELTAELARAQAHADHDIRALEAEGANVMLAYSMLARAMTEPD